MTMDGFGHPTSVTRTDPNHVTDGSACQVLLSCVNYFYNSLCQITWVTNPFFSMSDPTYGITYFYYDALGRKTQIKNADSSSSSTTRVTTYKFKVWPPSAPLHNMTGRVVRL